MGFSSYDELLDLKVKAPSELTEKRDICLSEVDRDTGWVKKPLKIAFEDYKKSHGIED